MSAVLRMLWFFYTALPMQRWLSAAGILLGAVAAGSLFLYDTEVALIAAATIMTIFVFCPTLLAGGFLLRALTAPRSHLLLPNFRERMLLSVALLMASLVLWFTVMLGAPGVLEGSSALANAAVFAFGLVTAVFFLVFMFSGDLRWGLVLLLLSLGSFIPSSTGSDSPNDYSLPLGLVAAVTSLLWVVFGVWFLRARRLRPLASMVFARKGLRPWKDSPSREEAVEAMLYFFNDALNFRRSALSALGQGILIGLLIWIVLALSESQVGRMPILVYLLWPLICMTLVGAVVSDLLRQSRLLWLVVEGGRDHVRWLVEQAAWRVGLVVLVLLSTIGLMLAFPSTHSAREIAAGGVLCVSGAIYGAYVSLASIPRPSAEGLGIAPMLVAQIGWYWLTEQTIASVALFVAVQLLGAALFRALTVRRWRRIDWRLVQPVRTRDWA